MALKASFASCEEAVLGMPGYFPCNKPAIAVVGWRNRSDAPIRMCMGCLNHNVTNRGGQIIRYVEDWNRDEQENPS